VNHIQYSFSKGSDADVKTVYYYYDANGNVTDLVNPDGSSAAHYEFDPYGNIISSTGTEAENNKFRFSTKYWDDEVGLYQFNYRYYSSVLGRFISRDPSQENGICCCTFVV